MTISSRAQIGRAVDVAENVRIDAFSVIGSETGPITRIQSGVVIGSFCMIEAGVVLGLGVQIDPYCRVCSGTSVGDDSRILYGAQVFEDVRIGRRCIIGGNLADRVVVEDNVTYFGETAHSYRIAGSLEEWDNSPQPSAIIRSNSVVGQNALIIGPVSIGPGAYVSAGETVRCDVPKDSVFWRGSIKPISEFRGFIQVRGDQ